MNGIAKASVATFVTMLSAAPADANQPNYGAQLCNPTNSTEAAKVSYSEYGVQNNSSSSAEVYCGGMPEVFSQVVTQAAQVIDRSTSAAVCCTFMLQNGSGAIVTFTQVCSTGSSSSAQQIAVNPPTNSSGLATMRCQIPAINGTSRSHVVYYNVDTI